MCECEGSNDCVRGVSGAPYTVAADLKLHKLIYMVTFLTILLLPTYDGNTFDRQLPATCHQTLKGEFSVWGTCTCMSRLVERKG